jgi:menaquinone reductase, molybdopterin-binding-like subunit
MTQIDRRAFLRLVGAGGVGTGAGFLLGESTRHPAEYLIPYPTAPEDASPGVAVWYNTVCSMCAAGCGISVRTREGRPKKIEGNPAHPVSQGRLCARGQAGLHVLYNPDRITGPLVRTGERGAGSFSRTSWDEGLAEVAERVRESRNAARASAIGLLTGGVRGHLAELLESFMAELGSERLLHYDFAHPHTLYAANERVFGERHLPYYDLKNTRFLVSFGADYLGSWISPVHHGLGFGHCRQGNPETRAHVVQIEPRMSLSGAAADEWLPANPGTEGLLALAMAQHIVASGTYLGADANDWRMALAPYAPAQTAEQVGVPAATISRLAERFAAEQPSLAIGGGSAGAHTNGADTLAAVNLLNTLVGNIGRPGGVIFNPEPAFGRASHPRQAGYRAMVELAQAARDGALDVLILHDANPVFTLPAAAGFEEALARIPLIVSLSSFMDETTAMADVILPSHTYLESWGDDAPEPGVGFAVGAISQPVVSPLYDTRATGDIILALGREAGVGDALPWNGIKEFLENRWRGIHATSIRDAGEEVTELRPDTPLEESNDAQLEAPAGIPDDVGDVMTADAPATPSGDLEPEDLIEEPGIAAAETTVETPVTTETETFESFWNGVLMAGVWGREVRRDHASFSLDRGLIGRVGFEPPRFRGSSDTYPFILHPYLSPSLHDGRGANLPWLQELPDPMTGIVYGSWLELNPTTAAELRLSEGDVVEVESVEGRIAVPVYVYPAIRPDVVAMPIGQGHAGYGRYAAGRGVNPIRILAPETDASTGSLAWSATRVRLIPTGRRVSLVRTAGHERQLGRNIVQRTAAPVAVAEHSARLNSIPITVVET